MKTPPRQGDASRRWRTGWGWPAGISLALMAVQVVLQLAQLRGGIAHVVSTLFLDDTFYYLQPAWNAHHLGFVTFDGINPTNGFHLLWFLAVWLLAAVSPDKAALVRLTLVACIALNATVHVVILRVAAVLERPRLAPVLSALTFALLVSSPLYVSGMENSLHFLVSWLVVWQLAALYRALEAGRHVSLIPLTVVLVLNVWTRLDSVLVSAAVFAVAAGAALYRMRGRETPPAAAATILLPAAGLAVLGGGLQAATYWLLARSPVPASSIVKAGAAAADPPRGLLEGFAAMAAPTFPHIALPALGGIAGAAAPLAVAALAVLLASAFVPGQQGHPGARALLAVAAAPATFVLLDLTVAGAFVPEAYVALLGLAALLLWRAARPGGAVPLGVWATVVLAFVVYHALWLRLGMPLRAYADWYYAPAHLAWILGFTSLAAALWVLPTNRTLQRAVAAGGVCFGAVLVAAAARAAALGYTSSPIPAARYQAANWIAANLEPGAVLASWNAGTLGYFCGHRLINLDGLVNTPAYARTLRSPGFRTADYLRANHVGWVVDWSVPPEVRPDLEPVRVFETGPGMKPVVLFRVRER